MPESDTAKEFRELVRADIKDIIKTIQTQDRRITIIEANNKWGNLVSKTAVLLVLILLGLAGKILFWSG